MLKECSRNDPRSPERVKNNKGADPGARLLQAPGSGLHPDRAAWACAKLKPARGESALCQCTTTRVVSTLRFLIHGLGPAGNRLCLGSERPRRPQKTIPEGGGLRPPPFGMVCGAVRASQTPKIGDCRPAQKPCIENPSARGYAPKQRRPEGARARPKRERARPDRRKPGVRGRNKNSPV
jgi:hypothetical protein